MDIFSSSVGDTPFGGGASCKEAAQSEAIGIFEISSNILVGKFGGVTDVQFAPIAASKMEATKEG